MGQRAVTRLSSWAVDYRKTVLSLSLLLALVFGLQLPRLRVDSSPDAVASSVPGMEETENVFRTLFRRTATQVLVILQARDVLAAKELAYAYRLQVELESLQCVASVNGLSHLELQSFGSVPPPELPPDSHRSAAESKTLESLSLETGLDGDSIQALLDADKESFPQGIFSLAAQLGTESSTGLGSAEFTSEEHATFIESIREATWLRPTMLSHDGAASSMVVNFNDEVVFDQKSRMAALAEVRAVLERFKPPEGLVVDLGGVPVLRETILTKLQKDRFTLNPAMMIVCLLLLGLTFRWWAAVLAPICAVGIAALMVIGGMAAIGQPLSILTNIIPPLLIIVGLSDSVHLLGRYQEELLVSDSRREAGRKAARAMLVACFLTSLTTAVGFASLASAETAELGRFGIAAAIGVVFAYFTTVLFVPAFVTYVKTPASWLKRDSSGRAKIGFFEKLVFRITLVVLKQAKIVAVLTVLSAALFSYAATKIDVDARLLDAFDKDEKASKVTYLLEEKLAGIRPLEIMLQSPRGSLLDPRLVNHVEKSLRALEQHEEVLASASFTTPLRELRASITRDMDSRERPFASPEQLEALASLIEKGQEGEPELFLSKDRKAARFTVFFTDAGVQRTLELVEELERDLSSGLPSDLDVQVDFLGEAYTGSVGSSHVLRDLVGGLGLALVSIFALLALLFRSLKMGIVAMPSNIVPLLATAAYMMARGAQLNMTTAITFSIGIGLAVDDTVHVVARFREERRRITSVQVSLLRAARGTGRAIVVTALSLSVGFSVLMLSEFVSVQLFGELIAVTILNCLVGALIIQPALLWLVTRPSNKQRSVA